MIDCSLPLPLLEPALWARVPMSPPVSPPGSPPVQAVLSVECTIGVGGKLNEYYLSVAELKTTVLRVSLNSLRGSQPSTVLRRAEAARFISRFDMRRIIVEDGVPAELSELLSLKAPFELSRETCPRARLSDWVSALLPSENLARDITLYAHEVPDAEKFPLEGLRFFGGFLRNRAGEETAHRFQCQWSRARALFSPQDEIAERASLGNGITMLNPTLQIVRGLGTYVDVFWRLGDKLHEKRIGVSEASIIDELSEAGRLTINDVLARSAPHARQADIEQLVGSGILL